MIRAPQDSAYMRRAVALARRGLGRTSPNPPVGAVVVRDGKIVGRGYHHRAGEAHGEANALREAGRQARGATLYVTLEPCAHHGRTPPCTDAVLASGVRRVVIGSRDPNPKVAGGGAELLTRAGLEVATGVLEAECDEVIAAFRRHVTTGLPLVTLKLAASLDGRIATASGDSRWISGEASRRFVHRLRDHNDVILVGAGTILADDPELTCRLRGGRNPLRVVVDGRLRLPLGAKVLQTTAAAPTVVVTTTTSPATKRRRIEALGAEVWCLPGQGHQVSLRRVMRGLGRQGAMSVLVEGGGTLAAAALREQVVDRLLLFLAPKLIGGDGRPLLGALGSKRLRDAIQLGNLQVRRFSEDLLLATEVVRKR